MKVIRGKVSCSLRHGGPRPLNSKSMMSHAGVNRALFATEYTLTESHAYKPLALESLWFLVNLAPQLSDLYCVFANQLHPALLQLARSTTICHQKALSFIHSIAFGRYSVLITSFKTLWANIIYILKVFGPFNGLNSALALPVWAPRT